MESKPLSVSLPCFYHIGFNGATASRPWREKNDRWDKNLSLNASMGPQPVGRGEEGLALEDLLTPQVASMGPQPVGRGEKDGDVEERQGVFELQWGHSQ